MKLIKWHNACTIVLLWTTVLLLDKKSFSSIDACRACILFHHPSCAETKRGSGFIGAEAFFVPSFLMISAGYFLMIFFDDDFLMVKSASIKHESTKLSVYCILKVYYLNFYINGSWKLVVDGSGSAIMALGKSDQNLLWP